MIQIASTLSFGQAKRADVALQLWEAPAETAPAGWLRFAMAKMGGIFPRHPGENLWNMGIIYDTYGKSMDNLWIIYGL